MTVKIYVNENRTFSGAGRGFSLGTTFENDVTTLKFVTPESLNYLTNRYLLVEIGSGILKLPINDDNEVIIGSEITTDENVRIQLVLTNNGRNVWRSVTYDVTFYESLGEATKPSTAEQVKEAQEAYRKQLANAVTAFSGQDHTNDTFEELTAYVNSAEALNAGEITVDKTYANEVTIGPPDGKNAISQVNIKGLSPRSIDISTNGFYGNEINVDPEAEATYWTQISVNVPTTELRPTNFSVNPSINERTYTYEDSDEITTEQKSYNCIGALTVRAVTSDIDNNIKPENIVSGVSILGVNGSAVVGGESSEEFNYLLTGLENIFATEVSV